MLIDALRLHRPRAVLSVASGAVTVLLGSALASRHGIEGMVAGVLAGRVIAAAGFPCLLQRTLPLGFASYARRMARPLAATALLWSAALLLRKDALDPAGFALAAAAWAVGGAAVLWFVGLDAGQRALLGQRLAMPLGLMRRRMESSP
jgi:O-antigen/teichoic acid export membrane protein